MTSHVHSLGLALLGLVLLAGSSAVVPITFQPESKLWVDGTSTVRAYSCKATSLQGSVAAAASATTLAIAELDRAVRTVEVTVPVLGLECGNGTMNNHLRNALKAPEHPAIRFQLVEYDVAPAGQAAGSVQLVGKLRIAGQERPITLDATLATDAAGTLRVQGSKELLMSEFGVKAPTLMLGTMKVRDRVVVHFDIVLKQS